MNLEGLIQNPWPEDIRKAADAFYQGHLIGSIPLFYLASPSHPATSFVAENQPAVARDLQTFILPQDYRYPYGIITSATCDIAEAGRPKNPFIQVSPVFNAAEFVDSNQWNGIKEGKFGDFVHLTSGAFKEGVWVADLRVSLPLDKGVLVGRNPIDAFETEIDRIRFAQRLAARVQRPALADQVHDEVVGAIAEWVKQEEKAALRDDSGRFSDVERICLRVGGDRLNPDWVQVFVFQETELSREDRGHWRRWRTRSARSLKKKSGIKLEPVAFNYLSKMSVDQYEGLIQLSIPGIGRRSRY